MNPVANSPYLHVLDGRIRVKIPSIKRSPLKAEAITARLDKIEGTEKVTANPVTGNLLILYNSEYMTQHHLLGLLRREGWLEELSLPSPPTSRGATAGLGQELSRTLLLALLENAVKRLVVAL